MAAVLWCPQRSARAPLGASSTMPTPVITAKRAPMLAGSMPSERSWTTNNAP